MAQRAVPQIGHLLVQGASDKRAKNARRRAKISGPSSRVRGASPSCHRAGDVALRTIVRTTIARARLLLLRASGLRAARAG